MRQEKILRSYQPLITKVARSLIHDPHLCEDAVQESLVAALMYWKTFDHTKAFAPWLIQITRRTCYKIINEARLIDCVPLDYFDPPASYDFTAAFESIDELQRVFKMVGMKMRLILFLKFGLLFTYEEVAELVDLPVGTVKSLICRTRKAIRNEI